MSPALRSTHQPGTRLARAMRASGRRLPLVATAIFASLTLSASSAHAAGCHGANLIPAVASVPTAKAATLCLLNNERAARGLGALSNQSTLEAAATEYSQSMVQLRFFGHVSPGGQTITDRLGSYTRSASSWRTGENLGWGEGIRATPSAIVKAWMASPSHRVNVLNGTFDEIGIGIVGGTPRGGAPALSATYTTELGARTLRSSSGSDLRASTASVRSAGRKKSTRLSAKKKKQISKRCHRVARRTKASKKTRQKRYERCMRTEVRAAKTRQVASRKCHRVSRRTKASKNTRKARYDRCMRSERRAAKKR